LKEYNNLMNTKLNLETAYQIYLESTLDAKAANVLTLALEKNGLELESLALKTYFTEGSGAVCIAKGWSNNRFCTVSLNPPARSNPGDLWFDPVELSLAILIPNPEGLSHHVTSWVSTHPVYVWQYRTFLNFVNLGDKIEVFPNPDDYLTPSRIDNQNSLNYITNIYHDEAVAYSGWMNKGLSGKNELNATKAYLGIEGLKRILPSELKLWEGSDFEEWYRTVIGINNLDIDPSFEYGKVIAEKYEELEKKPNRILYQEWDRRSYISMLTIVPVFCGLGDYDSTETFYYKILNTAPRPVLQTNL
jgi:hypothetical protein